MLLSHGPGLRQKLIGYYGNFSAFQIFISAEKSSSSEMNSNFFNFSLPIADCQAGGSHRRS
jgi:hypothetical protein